MKNRAYRAIALLLSVWLLIIAVPAGIAAEPEEEGALSATDFCNNSYIAEKVQFLLDVVSGDKPYFNATGTEGCSIAGNCAECLLEEVCKSHPVLAQCGIDFTGYSYRGSAAMVRFVTAWIYGVKYSSEIGLYGNIPASVVNIQRVGRVAVESPIFTGDYDDLTVENLRAVAQKGTAGDIFQMRTKSGSNHSMIFLYAGALDVTVLDCLDYGTDADLYNKMTVVSYSYEELVEKWDRVITLYRVDSETYNNTLSKGETVHTTHIYTDEGGDACTVCGEQFKPVKSSDKAGVYMAGVATEAYKGYYRSTGNNGTLIANGKWIEVTGSVVNSTGKLFYILAGGGYAAAEDFISGSVAKPAITIGNYPAEELLEGKSFSLSGTVTYSSGLSYVAGYLIKSDGSIDQSVKQSTSATSHNINSGQINAKLIFGNLQLGEYIYMVVACGKDGSMSCFKSSFRIVSQIDKKTPATPSAPTLFSITDSTVTLNSVSGCEYRRSGGSWQSSNVFTGLSPATSYTFYQRVKETDSAYPSSESAGLTVTTKKAIADAPATPVASSVSSDRVTLVSVSGCEYRIEGGEWTSTPTFTGLKPGESYTFYQRYKETATASASPSSYGLTVKLPKKTASTPSAPTVKSATTDSVTLNSVSGCEYRLGEGNWQSSPVFTGLKPGGSYLFYQRYAETADTSASPVSNGLSLTLSKLTVSAPSAPTKQSVTATTVILTKLSGMEYRVDGGQWTENNQFTGLNAGGTYVFYQRYAETDTTKASAQSAGLTITLPKKATTTPPMPTIKSVSTDTVVLNVLAGCEYRMDEGDWRSSPTFSGLTPGSTHLFYQRYAETDSSKVSPESTPLSVVLPKKSVSAPSAPTAKTVTTGTVTLTALPGMEYRIDGGQWTSNNVFTGLTPGRTVAFYQRYSETDTSLASPSSTALYQTLPKRTTQPPTAPALLERTANSVTLVTKTGAEYRIDGGNWQSSPVFTGLQPNKTYVFEARYAETATDAASSASPKLTVTTLKNTVSTPSAPVLKSIKGRVVTLVADARMEYRMDNGEWQSSNVFTVQNYGVHTFTCRKAETATDYASSASKGLTVTVNPVELTSEELTIKDGFVSGVTWGMTVEDVLGKINERAYVTVKNSSGKVLSANDLIATGTVLALPGGEEFLVAVSGDTNGDGTINIFDLIQTKNMIVNPQALSGVYAKAADVTGDGKVDIFDYIAIQNMIVKGLKTA